MLGRLAAAAKLVLSAWFRGDEWSRFILAERVCASIYPKYKFSEFGRVFLDDAAFLELYEKFEGTGNYHSLDRKYVLDQLLQLVEGVEGDTAECGAYYGHASYLICKRIEGSCRPHHIFDSFAGLSAPSSEDGAYWSAGDLAVPEDTVRRNLAGFEFVRFHKGWIPERFGDVADRNFCFVHIDVDLYRPTLDSLEFFYPRLSSGGIILCDDYGFSTCPGAVRAMDGFFRDRLEPLVRLPTGQAFVIRRR